MDFSGLFIVNFFENPYYCTIWALAVIFSVCCHEFAHAWTALWQGDPTAAENGHLTLNPLKQMGVFSLIMLAIMGIAWGGVPVNSERMKHKYSDAIVSLAGPLTNLFLFTIFLFGYSISAYYVNVKGYGETNQALNNIVMIFFVGSMVNILLFFLNILPLPPLDGWKIFSYTFPGLRGLLVNSEFIKGAYFILIILFISFFDYIAMASMFLIGVSSGLLMLLFKIAGL